MFHNILLYGVTCEPLIKTSPIILEQKSCVWCEKGRAHRRVTWDDFSPCFVWPPDYLIFKIISKAWYSVIIYMILDWIVLGSRNIDLLKNYILREISVNILSNCRLWFWNCFVVLIFFFIESWCYILMSLLAPKRKLELGLFSGEGVNGNKHWRGWWAC